MDDFIFAGLLVGTALCNLVLATMLAKCFFGGDDD